MAARNAPEKRKASEVEAKPRQPEEDRQEQLHEEGQAASSDSCAQCGPVCHSYNKSRSSSAEGEAEKNQGLQEEDEQSRMLEEQGQTASNKDSDLVVALNVAQYATVVTSHVLLWPRGRSRRIRGCRRRTSSR